VSEATARAAHDDGATGDEVVDAALADLGRMPAHAPVEEQVQVLDDVHEALRQRLSATQG